MILDIGDLSSVDETVQLQQVSSQKLYKRGNSMQRSVASLVAFAALICAAQLAAQAAPPGISRPTPEAPFTNGEIVRLTKAGLSPDLIVMKIKQAPSESLDVSTDALIALRNQNVSDVVIAAIFDRVATRVTPAPSLNASPNAASPLSKETAALPTKQGSGPYPDLELVRADGGSIRLPQLQGSVIMMVVWATWNGPSGKELPVLQKLYDLYRDRGFVAISLNVDTDRNLVGPFLKKLDISLPVYFPSPADADTLIAGGIPATMILGSDRTLVDRTVGYYSDWEERWKHILERNVRP